VPVSAAARPARLMVIVDRRAAVPIRIARPKLLNPK
jgi:hypothetical protein